MATDTSKSLVWGLSYTNPCLTATSRFSKGAISYSSLNPPTTMAAPTPGPVQTFVSPIPVLSTS